jgi:hypothetical protein
METVLNNFECNIQGIIGHYLLDRYGVNTILLHYDYACTGYLKSNFKQVVQNNKDTCMLI